MYEAKMMIKMVGKQDDIHIQKHVNIYFIKCHLGIFNSEKVVILFTIQVFSTAIRSFDFFHFTFA